MSRKIEELHATDLRIDHAVNRDEPPEATVVNLVKRWRRDATGVLTASRREDGMYYLLDGQTRRLAALRCDPTFRFVVEVHEGLSMAEEIDLFENLNKYRRQVSAIELLRLRVTRGREPYATLGIKLAQRNLTLDRSAGARLKTIAAAQPLEMLLAYTNGKRIVGDVLDVIIGAFPHEETRWRGAFMAGVANVYIVADRAHVPVNPTRMVKTLQRNLPRHWEMKARDRALTGGHAGTGALYLVVSMIITEQYNKRLTSNKLPMPWIRQATELHGDDDDAE